MNEQLEAQDVYTRVRHVLHTLRDASLVTDFPVCLWAAYGLKREFGEGGLPEWHKLPKPMRRFFNTAHRVDVLEEQEFERQKQLADDLEKNTMEQLHLLFKGETAENLLRSLGWRDTDRNERLRAEAGHLKSEISKAINAPAPPNLPIEPDDPTPDAVQRALGDWFDALAVSFLAKANEEPVRIVASLLARMIGNRAIVVQFINDLPMVGSVTGDQQQIIHCLIANPDYVALVQIDGKTIVGERIESEEIRIIFQEIGLPVWHILRDVE